MSKPAFTLIETLVAVVIAVILFGSTILLSRSIQSTSQKVADQTQETALASETMEQLRLTRDTKPSNISLSTYFGLVGQPVTGVFYAQAMAKGCGPQSNGNCPSSGQGGPVQIKGCSSTDVRCWQTPAVSGGPLSPICISTCPIGGVSMGILDQEARAAYGLRGSFDLIAVKHSPPPAGGVELVRDLLNASVTTAGSNPLAITATTRTGWDFYWRSITVSQPTMSYNQGTNQAALRLASYQVTVQVGNVFVPQSVVTQTSTLLDWR